MSRGDLSVALVGLGIQAAEWGAGPLGVMNDYPQGVYTVCCCGPGGSQQRREGGAGGTERRREEERLAAWPRISFLGNNILLSETPMPKGGTTGTDHRFN